MQETFDAYFCGEILDGHDRNEVKAALAKLFKLPEKPMNKLFSGKPVCIKKNLSIEKAAKLRGRFTRAGAIVHLVPSGQPFKKPQPTANTQRDLPQEKWRLLPPGAALNPLPRHRGPLPQIDEQRIAQLKIAPQGPLPQTQPEPQPPRVNLDKLSLAPANSGSLEAFTQEKPTVPIPDISHLEAAPPNTGSLEAFAQEKPPVPIPDISGLSLQTPKNQNR